MRWIICILLLGSCVHTQPVVIPADMEVKSIPGDPDHYIVSGAFLLRQYEDMVNLEAALDQCKARCP